MTIEQLPESTVSNSSGLNGLVRAINSWGQERGRKAPLIKELRLRKNDGDEIISAKLVLAGTNNGSFVFSGNNDQLELLNDKAFLDETIEPIKPILEKTLNKLFYEENYEVLTSFLFDSESPIELATKFPNHCRFCQKSWPLVKFKTKAHAIPASLGNRVLFSRNECDSCNQLFGQGIEFQLGNWSLAQRAFNRVANSSKFPSLQDEDYAVETIDDVTVIKLGLSGLTLSVFDNDTKILVTVPKRKYIPVAVFKAFVKMAISLMPDEEVTNFASAISWIVKKDHSKPPENASFLSGCYRTNFGERIPKPHVMLLRRKEANKNLPYMTLVIGFGSSTYQIVIPAPLTFQNESPTIPPFSDVYDKDGLVGQDIIDFANCDVVTAESEKFVLHIEGEVATELALALATLQTK